MTVYVTGNGEYVYVGFILIVQCLPYMNYVLFVKKYVKISTQHG